MKNITFIIGIMGNGGAERVVSVLSDTLANRGYKVNIITIYGNHLDYDLNTEVNYIPIECKASWRILRTLERCVFLRNHYKTVKPDVVVSFLADVNIHALISSLFTRTNIIVSERNDPYQDPNSRIVRRIRDIVYWRANGLVYQTPDAEKYFSKFKHKYSAIIPNPIKDNLPMVDSRLRKNEIVTACRLNYQKNLPMLIDAFARVQSIYKDYKLIIYGEGPMREYLEEYIQSKRLGDKVEFPGFSTNIHQDILRSKIFAISSNFEGISNSMLEAMAIGLPVIATDCPIGGAKMFIENNINGILVDVGDTEALAEAMIKIIENDSFANSLSTNAVNIRGKLASETIANMWIEFIDGNSEVDHIDYKYGKKFFESD